MGARCAPAFCAEFASCSFTEAANQLKYTSLFEGRLKSSPLVADSDDENAEGWHDEVVTEGVYPSVSSIISTSTAFITCIPRAVR